MKNGAPGRIRTSDHLIRSQVLYPAELRARLRLKKTRGRNLEGESIKSKNFADI